MGYGRYHLKRVYGPLLVSLLQQRSKLGCLVTGRQSCQVKFFTTQAIILVSYLALTLFCVLRMHFDAAMPHRQRVYTLIDHKLFSGQTRGDTQVNYDSSGLQFVEITQAKNYNESKISYVTCVRPVTNVLLSTSFSLTE